MPLARIVDIFCGSDRRNKRNEIPIKRNPLSKDGVLELVELARQKFDKEELAKQKAAPSPRRIRLLDFREAAQPNSKTRPYREDYRHVAGDGRHLTDTA